MLTEEELAVLESAANSTAVEYVSKAAAAARLGLSVRRVLELSARGLLKRHTVLDPATKRRQTVFLAADLDRLVEGRRDTAPPEPDSTPQSLPGYVSKAVAAERLGLSDRRVLELADAGLIKRGYVRDPVTKRRQTAFLAADVERLIQNRHGAASPVPDPPWLTLEEAAVYSGLPEDYLERQIRAGRLGAIDVSAGPAGGYRVARRDLDAIAAPRQSRLHGMSSAMNHEPPPGVPRYESGDAVSVGDLVQLRPGADAHWQTSLLLVCKIRDNGNVSGVVLRPHRSGAREAWYTYSLPEVARAGRAPFPPPERAVSSASYSAKCPPCLGRDGGEPVTETVIDPYCPACLLSAAAAAEPNDYSTWLTQPQAAEACGVHARTIGRWAEAKLIRSAKLKRPQRGPRIPVYHPGDVERMAQARDPDIQGVASSRSAAPLPEPKPIQRETRVRKKPARSVSGLK